MASDDGEKAAESSESEGWGECLTKVDAGALRVALSDNARLVQLDGAVLVALGGEQPLGPNRLGARRQRDLVKDVVLIHGGQLLTAGMRPFRRC